MRPVSILGFVMPIEAFRYYLLFLNNLFRRFFTLGRTENVLFSAITLVLGVP